MANLLLELLTTGQGFSPIQVKGENMTHLVTAYHRKYVHLITFNAITSRHSTARARRDMASIGQLILKSVHPKLQPTHTRGLRTGAHRYKNVNKNLRQDILSIRVYICFNFDFASIIISGINIILDQRV